MPHRNRIEVKFLQHNISISQSITPSSNSKGHTSRMADLFVTRMRQLCIGGSFQLNRLLGSGKYGKVYSAHATYDGVEVVIKLEHHSCYPSRLETEREVYDLIYHEIGFPGVFDDGEQDDYSYLAMELLGPTLEDLLQYCGGTFSLKTTLMLTDQLLDRFESLHSVGYIHGDIKPDNFLMGTGRNGNVVYITDLGSAQRIEEYAVQPEDVQHFWLIGNCRFASVQGHIGIGFTARDDLESLGYMLVYLMKGKLPWERLEVEDTKGNKDAEKQNDEEEGKTVQNVLDKNVMFRRIYEKKLITPAKDLCHGLPEVFVDYFLYLDDLQHNEKPSYNHLRQILADALLQHGFSNDNVFDWTALEYEALRERELNR